MRIPIYVGSKIIFLTDEPFQSDAENSFPLKKFSLKEILRHLKKKQIQELFLYHHNSDKLLINFQKKIKTVVAGGGRVTNLLGETLFIFRNDKWDLPKGRIEKKETLEEGSLREVKEETGVKKLKMVGPIGPTYHLFKRNGETKLKITHWFDMTTTYSGPLSPEQSEGITKAEWLGSDQAQKAAQKAYANIASVLNVKTKVS